MVDAPSFVPVFLVAMLLVACGHGHPSSLGFPSAPASSVAAIDPAVARVTMTLMPAVEIKGAAPARYALDARMKRYNVPGVSIAVADNGGVAWARGFGVRVSGRAAPVTDTTLFAAASIAKPVAATATMRLVDEGRLSLDANVNTFLGAWKIPENAFTEVEKVTLRRLLSHTAGTNVHSMGTYKPGSAIPSLLEVLEGVKPANTAPVRVEAVPGSAYRYSGGGVTIEQLALEEATGQPFPALMERLVLAPLGMTDSLFAEQLPPGLRDRAAIAHDAQGAAIEIEVHPEMAADGLWSTPRDLLKWAIEITAARAGRPAHVLCRASASTMLTLQKEPFGVGPMLGGSGRGFHFGHEGADSGYHAEVIYFPETGQGAAVMTNGEGGHPLVGEILFAIANVYGWPDYAPEVVEAIAVDAAAVERVVGTYDAAYEGHLLTAIVSRSDGGVSIEIPLLAARSEVVFTTPSKLVMVNVGNEIDIVSDRRGRVTSLKIGSQELHRRGDAKTP